MITDEQRRQRKNHLGGSDIAALFVDSNSKSLNPFQTATDVWTSKVFELKETKETDAMKRGNRYESVLIEYAEEELGVSIETNSKKLRFLCEDHPIFAANVDGFTIPKNGELSEIVEAKTTGLTGEWGEPGTADVPFRVNLQCQHQMLCSGMKKAHIVVLMGKWGLTEEMYVVERHEDIIKAIIDRGEQFWNDHVLTKTPPPDSEPGNINLFKKIERVPNKYADMDSALIVKWEELRQERLAAEKFEKAALANVLLNLGDAEAVNIDAEREFTYFTQQRKRLDGKRVKEKYPDVYEQCLKVSTFPVAKIRKVK